MAAPSNPPATSRSLLGPPPAKALPTVPRPGPSPGGGPSAESRRHRLPSLLRRVRSARDSDSDKSFGTPHEYLGDLDAPLARTPSPLAPPPTPPAASAPTPSRFRLVLGRSKSEADLRGKTAAAVRKRVVPRKDAIGAPLRPDSPPPLVPKRAAPLGGASASAASPSGRARSPTGAGSPDARARYTDLPSSPPLPSLYAPERGSGSGLPSPAGPNGPPTPTPHDYRVAGTPPPHGRTATGPLGARPPSAPRAGAAAPRLHDPGRAPRTPDSTRNRRSIASSATAGSAGAFRPVPASSPSARTDSTSARSIASGSYFSPSPRENNLLWALKVQSGWMQDDLLHELRLGERPNDDARPRRQREVLLGALTDEALQALTRAAQLSPTAVHLLTQERDRLHASRGEWLCESTTIACQVALNDLFYRLRCSASQEAMGRHRPRASHEPLEADVGRFLFDAVDLPEVMRRLQHPLAPEVRQALGANSHALNPQEAERLLGALHLTDAQRKRLRTHVERSRQIDHNLSPQGSLDSSLTTEAGELHSP